MNVVKFPLGPLAKNTTRQLNDLCVRMDALGMTGDQQFELISKTLTEMGLALVDGVWQQPPERAG